MQYIQHGDFMESLRKLFQKGGRYQKAARDVQAAWGRAKSGNEVPLTEVFHGLAMTNHGESRIDHCIKYDLNGFARLVTVVDNDVCFFAFAGDHTAVDAWLDRNRGLKFVASAVDGNVRLNAICVSDTEKNRIVASESDLGDGPLINLLPERCRERLLEGLPEDVVADISRAESITDENEILDLAHLCPDAMQAKAVLDVLLQLREGDVVAAKLRIDLYASQAKNVSDLNSDEIARIVSSDSTVLVKDVDPDLFRHFVETASFHKWMLYLHPAQREIVARDFSGPSRLLGVSGSGKTCVLIHRALRLAERKPDAKVAILTLNSALAKLIEDLIAAARGAHRPTNLVVTSVWKLCCDQLIALEPDRQHYYTQRTIVRNPYAVSEHIDEIWDEYYQCDHNNDDADVMFEVHRTLMARAVFPKDYLRQEIDFVRSAFSHSERDQYLEMERTGRAIPLERRYRELVLKGLEGWERKMEAVGAMDDIGIVTALHRHLDKLTPIFDHVLVDEVQDLGTLELEIVRKLAREGENDLFLCGDAAQTVHTKHCDLTKAQIDAAGRYIRLHQNYRNSRQILGAAHTMLTTALEKIPTSISGLEILPPEYANFSSPKPLLLSSSSVKEELAMAITYAHEKREAGSEHQKYCIAICGYPQKSIEILGKELQLPVLSGEMDLGDGWLFLSDLEQTKGFEFDLMVILNCAENVIPHPNLPEMESFRELSKLYVALTRAKTDLIVSHSGAPSRFIVGAKDCFVAADWSEHSRPCDLGLSALPSTSLPVMGEERVWESYGKNLLRLRDMVGLSPTVQDELLDHVTGWAKTVGSSQQRRQIAWKSFGAFFKDMQIARSRTHVISEQAWVELSTHMQRILHIAVSNKTMGTRSLGSAAGQRTVTSREGATP